MRRAPALELEIGCTFRIDGGIGDSTRERLVISQIHCARGGEVISRGEIYSLLLRWQKSGEVGNVVLSLVESWFAYRRRWLSERIMRNSGGAHFPFRIF